MYQVLLVDDETIFLEYMQSIINWEEFDCEICGCRRDGKAALEFIETRKPDIVFLDISMPLLDGIEVSRMVKARGLLAKLIIMTGHDEFSFAYQAIKIGIDDYLLKPFSREELIVALQKVLMSLKSDREKEENGSGNELPEATTKYEIITYAIEEFLNQNYSNNAVTMSMIAASLGFESSYLRRVYKLTTGMTIMQKLEMIRIEQAKVYLMSGKYQSQEIAEMVGFSDAFYFSKRFKKVCGVSPSEYRMK